MNKGMLSGLELTKDEVYTLSLNDNEKYQMEDIDVVAKEEDGFSVLYNVKTNEIIQNLEVKKIEKEVDKVVDGIAVQKVGQLTYEATRQHVQTLVGVDEGLISETLIDLYSKQGIVAEPAGAASIASLEVLAEYIKGKTICCIISGGNNDINRMPEMEERALIYDGIKHYFVVNFPQRPGALREFVNDILGPNDDITRFEYIKRASKGTGPVLSVIALADKHDYAGLIRRMEGFDPAYINLNGNETLYNMLV